MLSGRWVFPPLVLYYFSPVLKRRFGELAGLVSPREVVLGRLGLVTHAYRSIIAGVLDPSVPSPNTFSSPGYDHNFLKTMFL